MKNINYILFDAANTVIHKPALWPTMISVFEKYGYVVPIEKLKLHHKFLSEVVNFPDRTSREFYQHFNAELLMSLGFEPTQNILDDLFSACSYLPWDRFEDTYWIDTCKLPIGILSNFNQTLPDVLRKLFRNKFAHIIVSEGLEIRKPDLGFYQHALTVIGLPANQILYVGDSLKLDVIPASKLGFNTCLIDRINMYAKNKNRISVLDELKTII